MKLQELLDLHETPVLRKGKPPPMAPMRPFYSLDTLKRDFKFLYRGSTTEGTEFHAVIQKNKTHASIGIPSKRADGTGGMDIIGTVDLKPRVHLSGIKDFKEEVGKNVIQANFVEVVPKRRGQGWGLYLYTSLAHADYIVISDHTQYRGDQALWKKIAKQTLHSQYKVYVLDHGTVRLDEDGEPLVYDSMNIDDSELWSENTDRKYTLFALKYTGDERQTGVKH
jgi:hypothetical protein